METRRRDAVAATQMFRGDETPRPRRVDISSRPARVRRYVFGVSEWEVFWPLASGGTCVLAPAGAEANPAALAQTLASTHATHVFLVSAVLRALCREWAAGAAAPETLAYALQCGERLDAELVEAAYATLPPETRLANVYGPTEAAMTAWVAPRSFSSANDAVYVGAPAANSFVLVLARGLPLRPAAVGEVGELAFGGCLASGARPASTTFFYPRADASRRYRGEDGSRRRRGEDGSRRHYEEDASRRRCGDDAALFPGGPKTPQATSTANRAASSPSATAL